MESNEFQNILSALGTGLSKHQLTFSALGDPSRQAILVTLLNHYGGMRVQEIAESIGLSRPATSHHLKTLREAGLVDMYEQGTMNFYHVHASSAEWHAIAQLAEQAALTAEAAALRTDSEIAHTKRSE